MTVRVGSLLAVGVVLIIPLLFGAAMPAAAQSPPENSSDPCADAEQIDVNTALCSAEFNDGAAVLTFRSDSDQTITLTDAAAFSEGGEVPERDVELEAGEMTTVRFDLSTTDAGMAGVGVRTEFTLYSVVFAEERQLIGGPWSVTDARIAGLFGALSSSFTALITVVRRRVGAGGEPRRIA